MPDVRVAVPRYNYAAQFDGILDDVVARLADILVTGRYGLTEDLREFERAFAAYVGTRYALGVNSGTDALVVALRALGIGPGDDVVTQANTFHATVAAIVLVGANPVLVDADDETFLIDEAAAINALRNRPRALIVVHLYGNPTPMDALVEQAATHAAAVVEDAAQAHGARSGGRAVGSFGAVGCFSFHPSKNLAAAGDAGAVVTSDPQLANQLRLQRELGQRAQNDHVAVGLHTKLDTIQATILGAKLSRLDSWNRKRVRIAGAYRGRLADLPVSFQRPTGDHVFHLFQLRTAARDDLLCHLRAHGVDAVVRYPTPIHLQPAFAALGYRRGDFPVSERLARELLCLPIRPDMSDDEVRHVVAAVREFFSVHDGPFGDDGE